MAISLRARWIIVSVLVCLTLYILLAFSIVHKQGSSSDFKIWSDIQTSNSGPTRLFICLQIPDNYHIYSITQQPGGPKPTQVYINPGKYKVGKFKSFFPPTTIYVETWPGLPIEEHYRYLFLSADVDYVYGSEISGYIEFQPCGKDFCLLTQKLEFTVKVNSTTKDPYVSIRLGG